MGRGRKTWSATRFGGSAKEWREGESRKWGEVPVSGLFQGWGSALIVVDFLFSIASVTPWTLSHAGFPFFI